MQQHISAYLKEVQTTHDTGLATEVSYRSSLQKLLEYLLPNTSVTHEPRLTKCGRPDYVVTVGNVPFGYIETKPIGASLDDKAYKEQFDRYRNGLNNIIFTNYVEFRLYRNNMKCATEILAELKNNKVNSFPDNYAKFADLVKAFGEYQGQPIDSPEDLAKRMADKSRLLASVIEKSLASEERNPEHKELESQLKAFKVFLIHDITDKDFADVYAQTIAYGMFAARLHDRAPSDFSRHKAAELIPHSNPFLRKFFQHIAGYDLDERIRWIVDELASIFRAVDVEALMKDFGKTIQRDDPFIHFYETFLGAYDRHLRKSRGVFYTPKPVVRFIIRAVDDILRTEFGLPGGLADNAKTLIKVDAQKADKRTKTSYKRIEKEVHRVQILDPAAGTGTFLAEVVGQIHEKFSSQGGIWPNYVADDLMSRLNGFEIMMAPYAMAHLKLEMLLRQTGCVLNGKRLRIFLTNSLEKHHPDTGNLFSTWLSDESEEANLIKRDTPVMVVLGNPPYSAFSSNTGEWIMALIEDYKYVNGKHFREQKHLLTDDYVKFIRLGQHYIDRNGDGVLAYINNRGFLENPTFRGMRWNLLRSFDKIFVLDLHGNRAEEDISTSSIFDENVFDIRLGVSINLFVKTGEKRQNALGKVFYLSLRGDRASKYEYLQQHSWKEVKFKQLRVPAPNYYFVPKNYNLGKKYKRGFYIPDLMPCSRTGIMTLGDDFIICHTRQELKKRLQSFLADEISSAELNEKFDLGTNYARWVVKNREEERIALQDSRYVRIDYRPFDKRWTYFDNKLLWRWRVGAMRHLLQSENIGLVVSRQAITRNWSHVQVTNAMIDNRFHYSTRGVPSLFPLYLYPGSDRHGTSDSIGRVPNLNQKLVSKIAEKIGVKFAPEDQNSPDNVFLPIDLLDYIYAILFSYGYRSRYKEFLKIEFPYIPFPQSEEQFRVLASLGAQLRSLHLMEEGDFRLITSYPETGNNTVMKVAREEDKVMINQRQYFAEISDTVWNFFVGGYQPAQKYLKERESRKLTLDEIRHYQKIIIVLTETEKLMKKIDGVIA